MWKEHEPKSDAEADQSLVKADAQIKAFEADRNDAAWQSDVLKLCRDVSQCAKILEASEKNERTMRLARISHLKEQNRIGAQIVMAFADTHCSHMPCAASNCDSKLGEAGVFKLDLLVACL